ncbi:ABC transporter permease subunit [Actinomycetes bacterium KLBMP 9797]
MIWLTWRQFRTQAAVTGAALLVVALGLVVLGVRIRASRDGYLAGCAGDCADALSRFHLEWITRLLFIDAGLIVVPGFLGMFWGAPLVARELEAGTHRLVWNQSVPRRRWLAVKLLVVGLAGMAATGLLSALLTWAAAPVDAVAGDRFTAVVFGARNVVPVAYGGLAVVLGAVLGMAVRRTVPAMALVLVGFVAFQVAMPNLIRPHLLPPERVTMAMTGDTLSEVRGLGGLSNRPTVRGVPMGAAWVVSTSELRTRDGAALATAEFDRCLDAGRFEASLACLAALDLHVEVAYQPADRYWPFQWLESALVLVLAAALAAAALWRVPRTS